MNVLHGLGVRTPREWVETSRCDWGNPRVDFLVRLGLVWFGLVWFGSFWFSSVLKVLSEKMSCLLERAHVHQNNRDVPEQQGCI